MSVKELKDILFNRWTSLEYITSYILSLVFNVLMLFCDTCEHLCCTTLKEMQLKCKKFFKSTRILLLLLLCVIHKHSWPIKSPTFSSKLKWFSVWVIPSLTPQLWRLTQGAPPAPGVHHSYPTDTESDKLIHRPQGWEIEQKAFSSPEQPFRRHLFSLLLPFNYSEIINKAYPLKIAPSFF